MNNSNTVRPRTSRQSKANRGSLAYSGSDANNNVSPIPRPKRHSAHNVALEDDPNFIHTSLLPTETPLNLPPNELSTLSNIPQKPTHKSSTNQSSSPHDITLRIAGLGHHFELTLPPTTTLGQLKLEIEHLTELPAPYQRLVAKHKKLLDDSLVIGPTILEEGKGGGIQEMGIGLEDRTKLLLLHSPLYEADKPQIEKLQELQRKIDEVDDKRKSRDYDNKTVHELITQLCCKIDGVETNGSEAVRKLRKECIRRAEGVAKKSDDSKRGIDP